MTVAFKPLSPRKAADVNTAQAFAHEIGRPVVRSTPWEPDNRDTFGAAARAAMWRENTVASAWHEITDGDESRTLEEVAGYNPYSRLKETMDPEALTRLSGAISDGEFDLVKSDRQLKAVVNDILFEQDSIEAMESNGWGYFAGALLAGLVDPVSYIPGFGAVGKVSKIGKFGLAAAGAALSAGVSEIALQATQRDRSFGETLMNIGTAGVIGGGVGMFAPALHPRSKMNPKNPDNIFARENLYKIGEIVEDAHGIRDEFTPEEIAELRPYASAGAKSLHEDIPTLAGRKPGTWVTKVGDFINNKTIKGQVLRSNSGAARWVGTRLFDIAGLLTEANVKGIANAPSASILKQLYMSEYESLVYSLEKQTRQLSMELSKKADFKDVMLLTQRHLYAMLDGDTVNTMVNKYGREGFEKINTLSQKLSGEVHKYNAGWEKSLTEFGVLQDPALVKKLQADVTSRREAVKQAKESGADEITIKGLRAERDEASKRLAAEKSKGSPLGEDYGHAQMWNRDAVFTAPDEFKAFLHDVFALRPEEEWLLKNHHMSLEEFDELPLDEARVIREDWAGDEYLWRIEHLEKQLKGSEQRFKESKLDLMEQLRAYKLAKQDEVDITLSEARKRRDAIHTKIAANKAERIAAKKDIRAFKEAAVAARMGGKDRTAVELLGKKSSSDTVRVPTARQQGKAREAQLGLERLTREGEELTARAEALDTKLREIESVHEQITSSRRLLADAVSDAKKVRNIDAKSVSKVKRALRGARKRTPLNEMIEDVYQSLSSRGAAPQGILQRITERSDRETGRVKARGLDLTRDQRIQAIKAGWLRDDLSNILHAQTDNLAAELAIRESLDIRKGGEFGSWNEVLEWVERSYQDLMVESSDMSAKARLTAEKDRTIQNLIEARDRLKGGNYVDDGTSSGWIGWTARKARQANLIRYGSGFLLSSMTDTATFTLRHGSVSKNLAKYGLRAAKLMKGLNEAEMTQLQSLINALEIGRGAHAAARRFGTEDMMSGQLYGYGIGTGNLRKVTGAIDRAGEFMSEVGMKIGGLPYWNSFFKTVAGLAMFDRLHLLANKVDKLTASEIADMATLGLAKGDLQRIKGFMEKHGSKDEQGFFDPHMERWEGADGREAARLVEIAVTRDMNRAINTPDVGDTPRLMTTLHGSLLLTFQTFAFTFLNQTAYPMVQRMRLFNDKNAYMALGTLLAASTMVMVGKDVINGRDPSKRFTEENMDHTLYEIVDRSGVMGWMSPYADSALKLTSPLTGFGGGSRYARNAWFESIFGVNASLVGDVQRATGSLLSDDPDRFQKLAIITPFKAQMQLFERLLDN